ncbi:MAG: transketolase [candidate division Zixibacteria bacterium RBG_16_53_22]|nr:MAG: transketolase [candidate division Zixibacteria bacterium RBG_16_53_22]
MKISDSKVNIDQLCVNTIRFLAVDAVEKARSGHPGLPLGAASMAYVLYDRIMRFNPGNPGWSDRDRFILSAGHGCALQYALLHLTGYDLPLEEIKRFRQLGSMTPGHPEFGLTPGIEVTTGPLGQGFAMGVGMAMAERFLAARYNRPRYPIIDHRTYAVVSDGDLMEGISSEAASLAGHLGLSKLIYLYDDNGISIDGSTDITFTEDVGKRFEAYGWRVDRVADGNDLEAIEAALLKARAEAARPSLILVKTHIGFGSPKQDTSSAHGEPLGGEAVRKTKENLGWPLEPPFYIPDEALSHFRKAILRGRQHEAQWNQMFENYRREYPDLAAEFERALGRDLPAGWDADLPRFKAESGGMATRDASGKVMNTMAVNLPTFLGGSADLAASTKTDLKNAGDYTRTNPSGRNIRYGVREHAMGAVSNGMYQHGGVIPFTGTFLVFSDYMRPAIRLAAVMHAHVIFIFTHDSLGLGEDGPTHQPIGHLMSLRVIPGLVVLRPADANETSAAWQVAMTRRGPVALVLSRQKLPIIDFEKIPVFDGVSKGAYVLSEAGGGKPDIVLIATGSEVQLILAAREALAKEGINARAVSMPSWELFDEQPSQYRQSILPAAIPRLAIEAASPMGWHKYIGERGDIIGINRFGASAPGDEVMREFGFTAEHLIERAKLLLGKD